jgi:hypothetical protein
MKMTLPFLFQLYTSWVLFLTLTPIHVYKIHEPEARAKQQAMCDPPEVKTGSLILKSEATFPEYCTILF